MNDSLLVLSSIGGSLYALACISWHWRQGTLASPASLYSALVLVHFTSAGLFLGVGLAPPFANRENASYATLAVMFAIAGLMAFQVGSALSNNSLLYRPQLQFSSRFDWTPSRVVLVCLILLIAGWAARTHIVLSNAYFQINRGDQGELEGPFYAVIRFLEQFPLHVLYIVSVYRWRSSVTTTATSGVALFLTGVAEFAYWAPSGRKLETILVLLLPLMIRYLSRKKLPSLTTAILFVVFVVVLFPLAYQYRLAMELGGSTADLIGTIESSIENIGSSTAASRITSTEIILDRLSLLEPLSACVRLLDERDWQPMLGASYASVLLGFIPRILWPEKPSLHYGTDFGQAAGILPSSDWLTSVSVTYLGEAYLNFGWGGLLPMLVIGAFFGVCYRQTVASPYRETWLLLYVLVLPHILYVGGTAGLTFGGLLKVLPFYYLVGRMMTRSKGTRSLGEYAAVPARS